MNVKTKTVTLSILPILLFLALTPSTCAQPAELTVYPSHLNAEEGGVACFAVFLRGPYEGAINVSVAGFPFNVGSRILPETIRSGEAAAVSMVIPLNTSGDYAIRIRGVGRDVVMNATAYLHVSPMRNMVAVMIEPRILTAGQPSTLRVLIMPAHLPANLTILEVPSGRRVLSVIVDKGVYQFSFTPVNVTHLIVFAKIPGFGDHIGVVEIENVAPVAVTSTTVTTTLISKTTATVTTHHADQSGTVLLVILGTSWLVMLAMILRSRMRETKTGRLTTPAQMELRKQASLTKCVNCKRDISTPVCPYCGVRAKTANQSPNPSHCTMCGKEIFTRFCPYCGTRQ
jgi:hypothetical protein